MMKQFFKRAKRGMLSFLLLTAMVAQSLFYPQTVIAQENITLEINGYQINTALQAYRTVYSVTDPEERTQEVGLIYGLTDQITEADMVIGSTNSTVYSYAATPLGVSSINGSESADAQTYVMTMKFIQMVEFYACNISVRVYAKLKDGTYVYGGIATTSVYDIADELYKNSRMNNESGHDYLYDKILSNVNPSYEKVKYSHNTPIITPETTTPVPATEEPTTVEPATEELTTQTGQPVEVFGQIISSPSDGVINVVWGNPNNGQVFNVYLDGVIATDTNGEKLSDVSCASYNVPASAGTHTVKITGVLNGIETTGVTETVTVAGGTQETTEETTVQETTAVQPDGFVTAGANWNERNYWSVYFASGWGNEPKGSYKDGGSYNDFAVRVDTYSGVDWAIQMKTQPIQVEAGKNYVCKISVKSNIDVTNQIRFKEENSGTEKLYTLSAGTNRLELEFTATDTAQIFFDLGQAPAGLEFAVTSFSLEKGDEETQVPETEEPTTQEQETEAEEPTTQPPKNIVLDSYFDKIDVASSSTTGTSSESSANLFDGNVNTKMYSGDGMPIRIAWQMKQAVVVKSYTLTTANDSASYSYRNPQKWHLYGSNNATSWTQIDTVDNAGIGAVNFTQYTFDTDIQDSYQYYLLQIESNGTNYYGFQLAEISLYGDVAAASEEIGEDLNQYFDSIDTNSNTINGYNSEVPGNLFDGDTSTKMFNSGTGTIAWKMDRDTTIYSYSLTTANDNATFSGRNPKTWILYGSKDGNNWEQIDKVNNSGMQDVNYTTYTYVADRVGTYKYFKMNITGLYGSSFQLSELTLKGSAVSPSAYDILFTGDWNLITSQGYVNELVKLFYNSYPRLYARWGTGTEPKTITFMADSTYDGVAYCQGTTVCVSTTYANGHPNDIGFFSHEITHSVQQYSGKLNYGDDVAWWTENMANYGGFRYFHWSNPRYVQVYEASDTSLQDWGYEQYGNNKWFFAYMDAKYPTTKDANGNIKYGLIDSINRLIKANTGSQYTDDPYLAGSPFNNVVKEITGYDCIESLRLKYVEELQNGTWTFTGFANYADNWVTEDIEGVANPEYPMLGEKTHGSKTASQLSSAVTSGTNLCSGASIYDCSGFTNDSEKPEYLIDGNLSTKWCATTGSVTNPTYTLNQVKHWVMIDLGSEKTFNTYTLYNTQSMEGYGNATEWEILVSNDAKNWTSIDYQPSNNSAISSYDIGTQKARYVFIKVFTPDNGVGTLRLYEFQLYNR